jgi:hypothetical protein
MVSVTIYGSTLPGSNKYTAYPDGGNNRDYFRWYKNGEYAGLGQEVVINVQYNDIITAEFTPFYPDQGTVGSNRIRIGKTETIIGIIEPPTPVPVPPPNITISGSSAANKNPQTYTAVIELVGRTYAGRYAGKTEWYINDQKQPQQWVYVRQNDTNTLNTPKFAVKKGDIIYAKFYKNEQNPLEVPVESNRITITDDELENVIEPPSAPLIVPATTTISITGSTIADGSAQTYTANASGGNNNDKIAWYLNDKDTLAMGTRYSKVVKEGDVVSAIYYPFFPSSDGTTGSNRIKIGSVEEVKGIIEPATSQPTSQPTAQNMAGSFPSNILNPPIPPSKPEPESMDSIIMPPFIPMLPPMAPPMAPPITSPMADNITPYLPYIIGGVLLYVLFF